jgi:hypothetical protein
MRRLRVSVPALPIAHASDVVLAGHLEVLRRLEAKYRRRRLMSRLDDALDLVERANLAGSTTPPAAAVALIEELGGRPPDTALQAHHTLFALQRRVMRTTVEEGELADREDDDLVAAFGLAARLELLSELCAWLELAGRQVQQRDLPQQWQALTRARGTDALSVVRYDRAGRGGWRPYLDWRPRLEALGAAGQ